MEQMEILKKQKQLLIEQLKTLDLECKFCKHRKNGNLCTGLDADVICSECGADCICRSCTNNSNWTWCGEVESNEGGCSPFVNDPFAMVAKAFRNLYPDKKYTAYWEPGIYADEPCEKKPYGLTDFGADGTVFVFVDPKISVSDAVEIFAHELAHVAVGVEHDHDDVWEAAFKAIFDEYNRIGTEMFELVENDGTEEDNG